MSDDLTLDTGAPDAPQAAPSDGGWSNVTDPHEAAAAVSAGADKGTVSLSGPQFLATKDPARASLIQAIAEGRRQAPNGMALKTPYGQQLVQDVYQYDPTADDVNLPARVGVRKQFTSGPQSKNITSFNTALGHLDSMAQSVEGLNNTRFPAYNSVANVVGNQLGDTTLQNALGKFGTDKNAVIDELTRAFKGAAPDVHGQKGWEAMFDPSQPTSVLRTNIAEAAKLLSSRISAMHDSYNQGMGTTSQPLPMLTQHATDALAQLQGKDYLDKGYAALGVHTDGQTPDDGSAGPSSSSPPNPGAPVVNGGTGGPPAPPSAPAAPLAPTATLSADGSSDTITGKERAFNADANALFADPKSTRADFDALAQKYGRNPYDSSLDTAIAYRNKGGKGATLDPAVEHSGPSIVGAIANSGAGSAIVGSGETGTFGLLPKAIGGINAIKDKLTGNDQRPLSDIYANDLADAHAGINASEAAHPLAALGGQAVGFIGADAALSAIPGVAKLAGKLPGFIRPAVGDALTGTAYGAGSQDHLADVPGAALTGGLASAAGGVLGRGVVKGLGAIASPVVGGAVRRLTDAGVTLTPGQVLGGTDGVVGKFAKGIEDRLTGFSATGDIVNATRRSGIEDFNKAALNEQLAKSGVSLPSGLKAGHEANAAAIASANKIYADALAPLSLAPDAQLAAEQGAIAAKASKLSGNGQADFGNAIDEHVTPYLPANGQPLTGENLQNIKQGLDSEIATYRKSTAPNDAKLADRLSDVRDSYLALADRGAPAEAEAYRNARATYAGIQRVTDAASRTKDGVFTPNQYRQAIGRLGYGTTKSGLASGTAPGQQLATDASTLLPSSVPDSGTAGRAALGLALTGGAFGSGEGYREGGATGALTGAVLGSTLLSRPGAKAFQYLAAGSRGKTLNTLGDVLRRNAALGGAIGAPALLAHRGN